VFKPNGFTLMQTHILKNNHTPINCPNGLPLSKWLATYEPMIITHTKRRSANQQAGQRHLIDDYFQPVGQR
jgi:hypothetical protein